jgi:type I restriction enzyme S subunit
VRKQLYGQVRGQTRPGLNGEILGTVAIPIPPPAEQERILAEVERRLSVIDELEAIVEANLKRAERLRQAILKRAFEGRLVPQDPSDEPASVLLERIRAEREAKSASVKLVKPARKVVAQ